MMKSINLISPDADPQAQIRRVFGWLEVALVITMALMLAFTAWLQLEQNAAASQTKLKKEERQALKKDIDHASELEAKLATILDRQKTVEGLKGKSQDYYQLLVALAEATPAQLRFTNITTGTGVTINGIGVDRASITTFIDNLNKNPLFSKVQLAQANTQEDGVLFSLSLEYGAPAVASPDPATSPAATGGGL